MSNFDVVVGVSQSEVNRLLAGYHASAPNNDNPFKGREEVDVLGQSAVIEWEVTTAPYTVLDTPECSAWKAAQGEDGRTNEDANRPRPKQPMLQLVFPALSLKWGLKDSELEQGMSRNVFAHVTLDFSKGTIAMTVVALTVDQSEFEEFDKQLFNLLVLPIIFARAREILSVIHLPELNVGGDLSLKPLQISLIERCLTGATTLTKNPHPLDISSLALPQDPLFLLVSDDVINSALANVLGAEGEKEIAESGDFKGFADWGFIAKGTPSVTFGSAEPLTFHAHANMELNASIYLKPKALLLLTPLGCVIGMFV